ncbi:hypothetical protein [Frondihabitans australicus]|nr:hypothetical protein [Frondihabitans australicus]
MTENQPPRSARRRPDGPPAGVLAIVGLAFTVAAAATFTASDTLTGFFTFAASVPLGIYAATVYARLLRLGIRVPGPNIALVGGISASVLLAVSGLVTWAIGRSGAPSLRAGHAVTTGTITLVRDVAFALGGVGFVGGLGLLVAGAAVPSFILHLVPRPLAAAGLVIAAVAEVSFLALLWPGFDALLPIGRFAGLAWLIALGFLLPRDRREVRRATRT